jgi:mersacidin/lichenicidin family type 2 lantibiotic
MAKVDIARALKDRTYFNSLSPEEQAQVRAANPAGEVEVDDTSLDSVSGGLGERTAAITGTGSTGPSLEQGGSGTDEPVGGQNCNCNC